MKEFMITGRHRYTDKMSVWMVKTDLINNKAMMRFLTLFLFILIILSYFSSPAQEVITGLKFNPVVHSKYMERSRQEAYSATADTTPVMIPFYDDFSSNSIYPSPLRWIDRDAYVNADYPVYPIDLGVATLDAINDSGSMYPGAVPGPQAFIADHLTSRYIRLDSLFTATPRAMRVSDSIYMSFWYQPQGRGLAPQTSDSLILEFLAEPEHDSITPSDSTVIIPDRWRRIWSSKGMSLDTFYIQNHVYFKRVMIPITDSATFYRSNFRFQFYNYVSLASDGQPSWQSNTAQWNVDDIYLNSGRTMNDTIHKMIGFLERPPTMLKKYTAMPYTQYCNDPSNEVADSLYLLITNRDTVDHNSTYHYSVTQAGGSFTASYNTTFPLTSFYQFTFPYTLRPPVSFIFPISGADSARFLIQHTIKANTTGSTLGDTIEGYQNFYNYYSYDDGTPEAGYGLKGAGTKMASRFSLNKSPDTLRAVRIYFNRTLSNANLQAFFLTVWNDNDGTPGDTIYCRLVNVNLPDTFDQFATYHLEVPVRISGTFYVGTIQTTDDNLNIGFDTYNDAHDNLLYNAAGRWLTSSFPGAILLRPVIGKPLPVGIHSIPSSTGHVSVFPNPNNTGVLELSIPGSENKDQPASSMKVEINNLFGQKVFESRYSKLLQLPDLPAGLYIITVNGASSARNYTGKLVITK
jgi:hypothetical protein